MEKTFSEMVSATYEADETQRSAQAANQQDAVPPVVEDAQATDGASAPAEATPAPAVEQKQAPDFVTWLSSRGYEVDGVDPEDLFVQVETLVREGQQARSEVSELKRKLEEQRTYVPQQPQTLQQVQDAVKADERQEQQRRLSTLQPPDTHLYSLVERTAEGEWIAKEGYGAEAIRAAQVVNEFHREKNRRADKLLLDPLGYLGEDLDHLVEDRAKKLLERELSVLQEKQQKEREQVEAERARQQEYQKREEFFQKHKGKIFVLDHQGNPRKMLNSDNYAITSAGDRYFQELNRLQSRFPNASELDLMEEAIESVSRLQQVPVVHHQQVAPVQPVQKTPEQVRAEYSAANRTNMSQIPSQGTRVADMNNTPPTNRPRRFADLIKSDPANADNPAITAN